LSTLVGLWLVSLAICALALAIMLGLIIARRVSEFRAKSRQEERRRLVPMLLDPNPEPRPQEVKPAPDLLADLFTELIQMVRGTDREKFVASSSRLGVPQRLRQRLDYGSPRIRLAAAEALGDFDDEQSMARLHSALDDPNEDVRLAAALALAEAGHAPNARLLVEKLGIGTSEHSMLVVGLFEDIARDRPEEVKAIVEAEDMPAGAKAAAIEALTASGDYSLVPIISRLVLAAGADAEELPRYLQALGEFGHPAGARAVEHALGSPRAAVRAAAAEAAGRIVLGTSASRLAELLEDQDWWVRFRAGEALARLGDEGQGLLRDLAEHGSEAARETARLTLAERGLVAI
jgi:HEAT repeat protein